MSSIPPSRLPRRGAPPPQPNNGAPPNWAEIEAKYKQDIEALTESTEMAAIEKEIAEEKLDTCQRELKEAREKLTEAMNQVESLTGEQEASNSSVNLAGHNESSAMVFQVQKLEEHNELLKQAIIKLRDISTNDKRALEELQLEHEELQIKFLDLEEKQQRQTEQIKIYEEQIDVSQSAQEMVEKLTQQKTELEDKLREMIEDIDNMEKLSDLNEQLLETARENEIELTGEMDKLRMQLSEMNIRRRELEEYLMDKERNLMKLRDENRDMQEQINRLNDQFKEGESLEQQKHHIENVAYKLNFSESKMAEKESELMRCKRNLAEMEEQMNNLSIITKEQSSQIDDLKLQLDAKIGENSELQRALKRRMEEVSELEIRRDMAERKLASSQREMETKLGNLNRIIETMKGIEVQHEEEIKRLMEDNELIEIERRDLRDQLNKTNRSLERSMQAGMNLSSSMVTAQDTSLASLGITYATIHSNQGSPIRHAITSQQQHHQQQQQQVTSHSQASQSSSLGGPQGSMALAAGPNASLSSSLVVDESPLIMTRVRGLSEAFDFANKKNQRLELELALNQLVNRRAPYVTKQDINPICDMNKVKKLIQETNRLKREIREQMINQQICTKTSQINMQTRNDNFRRAMLTSRYQKLQNEVRALLTCTPESGDCFSSKLNAPMSQSTPVKSH